MLRKRGYYIFYEMSLFFFYFMCQISSIMRSFSLSQMVVFPQPKIKIEDDDDDDLERLRMAALQSIGAKDAARNRRPILPQVTQTSRLPYKYQRPIRRNYHYNRVQQRQNGVSFLDLYICMLYI